MPPTWPIEELHRTRMQQPLCHSTRPSMVSHSSAQCTVNDSRKQVFKKQLSTSGTCVYVCVMQCTTMQDAENEWTGWHKPSVHHGMQSWLSLVETEIALGAVRIASTTMCTSLVGSCCGSTRPCGAACLAASCTGRRGTSGSSSSSRWLCRGTCPSSSTAARMCGAVLGVRLLLRHQQALHHAGEGV